MGGVFGVTFGIDAGDTQCIQINLVSDNEREEREQFFVDVDLDDMGPIRAGNPSRTTVGIEGMAANFFFFLSIIILVNNTKDT